MKLATVSHSHVARRQQLFFEEVAKQGHEVLMIGPGEWGNLMARDYTLTFPDNYFSFRTCRHMLGENVYTYHLLGARDLVVEFGPDWLYIQAEPESSLAQEAYSWGDFKKALFTWENIQFRPVGYTVLDNYDLVICGNPEAQDLVKPWNSSNYLMLQVGIDTDHFQARPGIPRDTEVGYIGRATPEKGLPYLSRAWPGVRILEFKDFRELPWWYSQIQVLVAYSQDMPWWKEQAPNYVVLEALSCGCKVVTSDTASMKYWLEGCPGVAVVNGHDQPDDTLQMERVDWLRTGIEVALQGEDINEKGRQWVIDRFSNPIMAKELLEVLKDA